MKPFPVEPLARKSATAGGAHPADRPSRPPRRRSILSERPLVLATSGLLVLTGLGGGCDRKPTPAGPIHRPTPQPATDIPAPHVPQPIPASDAISSPQTPSQMAQWPVRMTDVTEETGITFRHTDGSSGRYYIMESITGGLALFDYDNDGDLDVYFLNGAPLNGAETVVAPTNALYRNDGDWKFSDVTAEAGVGDTGYGIGVCIGDYNNDGAPDVYVNNFGPNVLYQNRGDGTFVAVTGAAGVANGKRVGAGASFLDIDGDGDLDLYVASYVQFSYAEHRPHTLKGLPAYPGPLTYLPEIDALYRNNGDGTFADASIESGIAAHAGTGMGVVSTDYDHDGDTDIFVANDQMANFLFQNDGSGRFEEVGLLAGTALDLGGHAQATMGIDAGDFDNDGRIDFHTTSFAEEFATLYRNTGDGLFQDVTRSTDAGDGTFPHVTWGNGFADFDNDGDCDLFIACGHLDVNLEGGGDTTAYRVPNRLLMNTGERFVDVSLHSGNGMRIVQSSRGVALGDLDNDGDIDAVALNSRRQPTILRNDSSARRHWIKVRLRGVNSNRQGIGARLMVVAEGHVQTAELYSGRGYQSHFGDPLHFGLGHRAGVERVEIHWLGGGSQTVYAPPVNSLLSVTEVKEAAPSERPTHRD